mgnify:CR=1 FL=1
MWLHSCRKSKNSQRKRDKYKNALEYEKEKQLREELEDALKAGDYVTIEDVKRDMFRYIELFYNRKRLHSILGYMSPVAYRLKYDRENVAAL